MKCVVCKEEIKRVPFHDLKEDKYYCWICHKIKDKQDYYKNMEKGKK